MAERQYNRDDALFALTSGPELAVQLTCENRARWRVMVFEIASKKAAIADHYEKSLADAKRFVSTYVRDRFGLDLEGVQWREALGKRQSDV